MVDFPVTIFLEKTASIYPRNEEGGGGGGREGGSGRETTTFMLLNEYSIKQSPNE